MRHSHHYYHQTNECPSIVDPLLSHNVTTVGSLINSGILFGSTCKINLIIDDVLIFIFVHLDYWRGLYASYTDVTIITTNLMLYVSQFGIEGSLF